MKRSSRLSVALHVLVHLAERPGALLTSEVLAVCAGTNPVVVRRTMAALREAGLVASTRGPGGGLALARPADTVTLADVHRALGEVPAIAAGPPVESPGCLVEAAVADALDEARRKAEAFLATELGRITLATLAAGVRSRSHRSPEVGHVA